MHLMKLVIADDPPSPSLIVHSTCRGYAVRASRTNAAHERITRKKIALCVILTAYRDRKLIDKAKQFGAYTFPSKPLQGAGTPRV